MTFTAGSAEKKLASFILDHERDGIFSPPCSMIDLASMLGMGRASLYRAMDQLISQGWIEKKNKVFMITDLNALTAFI
jgi:DNA-binding MarR family transcriptional regulator